MEVDSRAYGLIGIPAVSMYSHMGSRIPSIGSVVPEDSNRSAKASLAMKDLIKWFRSSGLTTNSRKLLLKTFVFSMLLYNVSTLCVGCGPSLKKILRHIPDWSPLLCHLGVKGRSLSFCQQEVCANNIPYLTLI